MSHVINKHNLRNSAKRFFVFQPRNDATSFAKTDFQRCEFQMVIHLWESFKI